jgi:hypothetical protein
MFCGLLASGLHRVLEFDRAHMGLPLSRLALYSRRETAEWAGAWSARKGAAILVNQPWAREAIGSQYETSSSPTPERQDVYPTLISISVSG